MTPENSSIQAITDQNLTYFYNPCHESTTLPVNNATANECSKGYMLCVYNKEFNNFTLLGSKEDASFGTKNGRMFMSFGKAVK